MKHYTEYIWFHTGKQREFINITGTVQDIVQKSGVDEGMVLVSAMHLSLIHI